MSSGSRAGSMRAMKPAAILAIAALTVAAIALVGVTILWLRAYPSPTTPPASTAPSELTTRTLYNGTIPAGDPVQWGEWAWGFNVTAVDVQRAQSHARNLSGPSAGPDLRLAITFDSTVRPIELYLMNDRQFHDLLNTGGLNNLVTSTVKVIYQSGLVYHARDSVRLNPTPGAHWVVAINPATTPNVFAVSANFVLQGL